MPSDPNPAEHQFGPHDSDKADGRGSFRKQANAIQPSKAARKDTSKATEIVDEAEKYYSKSNPLYYIDTVGATVVYLIVFWKLFTMLVF